MDDDAFIPISALQHYLYCPRQCALIHLEQQWAENRLTAEGRLLHERTDMPRVARRKDVRTVAALPLVHVELGITGRADIVEFNGHGPRETVLPVEYKRGRPKGHRADEVQLCAQALCLESMLECSIPHGALFYGKTRRRKEIAFDDVLRNLTREVIVATRAMLLSGRTPGARYDARRCEACSLLEVCQPHVLGRDVAAWLRAMLAEDASCADS